MTARLCVIGGGAAGLAAAFQARRRGAEVTLVERDRLGGDCTWTGCVPSKGLLDRARDVAAARRQGCDDSGNDARILEEARTVVAAIAADESAPVLQRLGVRVRLGDAAFTAPGRVSVDGEPVDADRVVLATGAQAAVPTIPGLEAARPLTNATVFDLPRAPARLAVLGGGPVGVELGQAFARLGSRVTLLEARAQLLPREDPEAAAVLGGVLAAEGLDVRTGAHVTRVSRDAEAVRLELADGAVVDADELLVATGRVPVTDGLGLERGAIRTDARGFVQVDDRLRTSANAVWAAGDVTGAPPLTHLAYDQGALAADNALRRRARRFDGRVMPQAIYTDPEVARVGMTEADAAERVGDAARVAKVAFRRVDRGRIADRTEGFVKLIAGPRRPTGRLGGGQLLGATIVGPTAGDMIAECALAMRTRMLVGRLAQTVHPYPSWSLAVRQAAAQFFRAEAGGRARPPRGRGTS